MNIQHFSTTRRTIVRSLTLFFLVLAGLTLASGWVQAQDSRDAIDVTGSIAGIVTDEAGSPISEIQVAAHEEESLFPTSSPAISAGRQDSTAPCDLLVRAPMHISPDGKYLLYRMSGSPGWDLYSFSTTDGIGVNLGSADDGDGYRFSISPDSKYVVFSNQEEGLRSVPIGGGTPFRLSSGGGGVKISPDSKWVVYQTKGYLYSVPITGGTSLPLMPVKAHDAEYTISPDSKYLVYSTDKISQNKNELYSVPISGGAATKLSGELPTGGFEISANGAYVVYSTNSISNGETWYGTALYSVPITGSTSVLLNGSLATGRTINHYKINSDSTHVVYFADQDTDEVNELYSVPITGGTPIKLNAPSPFNGHVVNREWPFNDDPFYISKDSRYVVYLADQAQDTPIELYSIPITGGLPIRLNGPLAANGDVRHFKISSDSQSVIYTADQDIEGQVELYSVPLGGGSAVKLNAPLSTDEDVSLVDEYPNFAPPFDISADNMHVVYVTKQPRPDQSSYGGNKLYSVNITAGAVIPLLNTDQSPIEVYGFELTPDGGRIIYYSGDGTFSLPIVGGVPIPLALQCNLFLPLVAR